MTITPETLPQYLSRPAEWPTLELATSHAEELRRLVESRLPRAWSACHVADIGSGTGTLAMALARPGARGVAAEENATLVDHVRQQATALGLTTLECRQADATRLTLPQEFDLAILSTVIEHTPDQPGLLAGAIRALRPGGILYLTGPNRLWPIEQHYGLPALHWLPLPLANRYLALAGKGASYADACYSTTYGQLRRLLDATGCPYQFVTPANVEAPIYGMQSGGRRWLYRLGISLIRRNPGFWWIAKGFIVLVQKR